MLLTLTDRLTCPACGPATGLIVLMEQVEDRRVVSGSLGCPVCRRQYRIDGRVADLRRGADVPAPPALAPAGESSESSESSESTAASVPSESSVASESTAASVASDADDRETALRVAALLGLTGGSGFVLVDGPSALGTAAALGEFAPDHEAVAVIGAGQSDAAAGAAVSALLADESLPLGDASMRGAAYAGTPPSMERLRELVRVVRPTGRVVLDGGVGAGNALDGLAEELERLGAEVRARDGRGLLAVVM